MPQQLHFDYTGRPLQVEALPIMSKVNCTAADANLCYALLRTENLTTADRKSVV